MDCNPSAPSTSKNTNMNIRRKKNNKKTEENKRWKVTAGARAGIITDAGFIGGDRTGVTCCCEEKLKPYSLNVWGGRCGYVNRSFPLQRSRPVWQCAPLVLGVFEHNTKIWAGSTRWFFSTCLWQNTTRTTDTAELNTKGRLQCHVSYKCFNFKTDH